MSKGKIFVYKDYYPADFSLVGRLFNFDVNKAELKKEHQEWLLKEVQTSLMTGAMPRPATIGIIGMASRTYKAEYNLNLSKSRAESVLKFLRSLGSRVKFNVEIDVGVGETAAAMAGQKDDVEDEYWRAVTLLIWRQSSPPPPPNWTKRPLPPLPTTFVQRRSTAIFLAEYQVNDRLSEDAPGAGAAAGASMAIKHYRNLQAGGYHFREETRKVSDKAKVVLIVIKRGTASSDFIATSTEMKYAFVRYEYLEKYPSGGPILIDFFNANLPVGPKTPPVAYRLTEQVADLWFRDAPKAYTELRQPNWERVDLHTVIKQFHDAGGTFPQ